MNSIAYNALNHDIFLKFPLKSRVKLGHILSHSPFLFNIILLKVLSNMVFADNMIMYRKFHRTCTKKLETMKFSRVTRFYSVLKKSYFYVLAVNN